MAPGGYAPGIAHCPDDALAHEGSSALVDAGGGGCGIGGGWPCGRYGGGVGKAGGMSGRDPGFEPDAGGIGVSGRACTAPLRASGIGGGAESCGHEPVGFGAH